MHAREPVGSKGPASSTCGPRFLLAMSGRGHGGKRPRGDGSRGPRTASCTGWSQNKTASLFGSPTVCDFNLVSIPLIASVAAQQSNAAWIILPWIILLRQLACYRSAAVVTHLLPSISFIIHLLLRPLHHTVIVLFMAMDLFMPRCLAAPVPLPTPLPQPPTPTPSCCASGSRAMRQSGWQLRTVARR